MASFIDKLFNVDKRRLDEVIKKANDDLCSSNCPCYFTDYGVYEELKTKYKTQILPTSMYQTGVNPEVAKELWKISEISYNCWEILVDTDYDNIVGNALGMAPYIKGWSEIDIEARSWVLTYEQQIINANSDEVFDEKFNFMTTTWLQQKWTKEVNDNVQAWHKSK